ncbi:MAG: flagellin, partial [Candidatus Marinimicrobia bacterium]|nr:flagellin [Candidatus Neomarinimicrobiota bacterium]
MGLGQIATNIEAQKAYHSLTQVNNRMSDVQLRMATGKKINSPEDDPAGY